MELKIVWEIKPTEFNNGLGAKLQEEISSIAPSFWPQQLDERLLNKIENTEKGNFLGCIMSPF